MKPIALVVGSLMAVQVHAQDDSWDRIRQGVLAHPALEHRREMLQERRGEVGGAGRIPPPRLELELENFAGSGGASGLAGSSLGIWAGSDYRLGDVRGREKELAAQDAALQVLDTLRTRRELLWAARDAWELWRRERWMAELSDSLAGQVDTLVRRLERGREAGRVGPWEVSLARSEHAKWRLRSNAHRRMAKSAWNGLSAWGADGAEPVSVSGPVVETSEIGEGRGMDSMVLEAERVRMGAYAALLEAQDRPVVSGALGVLRDQSSGDVTLGARVSLPLPPWNRPGLEAIRSRNQVSAAGRGIDLVDRERTLRRAALRGRWDAAIAELRTWETDVVPAHEQALRQVELSHVAGAVDASAVWAVRKELWEARIERLERMIRVLEVRREREILEGVEP